MNNISIEDILKMPVVKIEPNRPSKVGKVAHVGIYRVADGYYKPERKVHKTSKLSDIL